MRRRRRMETPRLRVGGMKKRRRPLERQLRRRRRRSSWRLSSSRNRSRRGRASLTSGWRRRGRGRGRRGSRPRSWPSSSSSGRSWRRSASSWPRRESDMRWEMHWDGPVWILSLSFSQEILQEMKHASTKGTRKSTGSRKSSPQSIAMQKVSSDQSSSMSGTSSSYKSEKQKQLEAEKQKLAKEKAEFEEWKKRFLHWAWAWTMNGSNLCLSLQINWMYLNILCQSVTGGQGTGNDYISVLAAVFLFTYQLSRWSGVGPRLILDPS